jgi:hypothetical protein
MWWMLLIALADGTYQSEQIVKTEHECVEIKTQDKDLCVQVTVRFETVAPKFTLQ